LRGDVHVAEIGVALAHVSRGLPPSGPVLSLSRREMSSGCLVRLVAAPARDEREPP